MSKFSIRQFISNPHDEHHMRLAIAQAETAAQVGEVPIAAVITYRGEPIAQAHNSPVSTHNPCAHAEIRVIEQACKHIKNYRLGEEATLYVTLSPCLMCLGAILHARIGRVVIGLAQSRFNHSLSNSLPWLELSAAWHPCQFEEGCLPHECEEPLISFFREKRTTRMGSLSKLERLADLPNVNKVTLSILNGMGYLSGKDFLEPSLDFHVQCMHDMAQKLQLQKQPQQAAILFSLCEYLQGEPVRSWKSFL